MSSILLFCALSIALLSFVACPPPGNAYVRYAHTVPQFGRANVTAAPPKTVLFEQVRAGTATRYKPLDTNNSVNFTASFQRGANATTPTPYGLSAALSYTIYTHIAGTPAALVNKVIRDCVDSPRDIGQVLPGVLQAYFRVGNVVNVGLSATVTGQKSLNLLAPPVTLFTDVPYAEVTNYTTINAGLWTFDYTLSPSKRQPGGDGNLTVIFPPGSCNTLWMISGGGMIVADGFGANAKRTELEQTKMRRSETLKQRAEAETPEVVEVVEGKH